MGVVSLGAETDIRAVIFDVGNVLIQWDPRHLFRKLFADEAAMETFLAEVCTMEWNVAQDLGRSWADAVAERIAIFPEHAALIRAYDERWHEMVTGEIGGSVRLLEALAARAIPLYALTNFSEEKFVETQSRYRFFRHFDDIVVSAREGIIKPGRAIFERALSRFDLEPGATLFIDDSPSNVEAALALGLRAHHFTCANRLRDELIARKLLEH